MMYEQVLTEREEDFMLILLKIGYVMIVENDGVIINGEKFTSEELKDMGRKIGLSLLS